MRVKSDDPPNIDELALLLFFFFLSRGGAS